MDNGLSGVEIETSLGQRKVGALERVVTEVLDKVD